MAKKDQFQRRTDRQNPGSGTFDLVASLRGLFAKAEKENDATAAASLARVLKDMERKDSGDSERTTRREYQDRVVSLFTPEERSAFLASRDEMNEIFVRRSVLLTRAALRNGIIPILHSEFSKETRERIMKLASSSPTTEPESPSSPMEETV
jgi:hypothetical protein